MESGEKEDKATICAERNVKVTVTSVLWALYYKFIQWCLEWLRKEAWTRLWMKDSYSARSSTSILYTDSSGLARATISINVWRFIVNMIYAFQDRENLYLIMDLMPGGDLRYHLAKQKTFNEATTSNFAFFLSNAFSEQHLVRIFHCMHIGCSGIRSF